MIVSLAALGLASPAIAEISCKILKASSEIIRRRLPASLALGLTIFFAPSYKLVDVRIANYYLSTGEGDRVLLLSAARHTKRFVCRLADKGNRYAIAAS